MTKQNTPATIHPEQWEVIDGIARPKNPYFRGGRAEKGTFFGLHDSEYDEFEQFATQHSYPSPGLKDAVYEAKQLQFVWQYKQKRTDNWETETDSTAYKGTFEEYCNRNKDISGMSFRIAITATPTEVKEPEEKALEIKDIWQSEEYTHKIRNGIATETANKIADYFYLFQDSKIERVAVINALVNSFMCGTSHQARNTPTTLLSEGNPVSAKNAHTESEGKNDFTPNDIQLYDKFVTLDSEGKETVEMEHLGVDIFKVPTLNYELSKIVEIAAKIDIDFENSDLDIQYVAGAKFGAQWQSQHTSKEIEALKARVKELESVAIRCEAYFRNSKQGAVENEILRNLQALKTNPQ